MYSFFFYGQLLLTYDARPWTTLHCFHGAVARSRLSFASRRWARQVCTWKLSESLVQQIAIGHGEPHFIIADLSEGYSSGSAIERFSDSNSPVIAVSSIAWREGCTTLTPIRVARNGVGYHASSTIAPGCGSYNLFGSLRPSGAASNNLQRHLDQADISYSSPAPSKQAMSYVWTTLDLEITPKLPHYTILAPDVAAQEYRVVAIE